MNAEAIRVRYIVVGIGINVNQESFPKGLNATSLQLVTGKAWSRVELVAALLKSLDTEYHSLILNSGDHKDILQRFAENSSWVKGKKVRIEENGRAMEGVTEGLDPRGFLQLRTAYGIQTVLSGRYGNDEGRGSAAMLLVIDVGNTNTVLGVFARAPQMSNAAPDDTDGSRAFTTPIGALPHPAPALSTNTACFSATCFRWRVWNRRAFTVSSSRQWFPRSIQCFAKCANATSVCGHCLSSLA